MKKNYIRRNHLFLDYFFILKETFAQHLSRKRYFYLFGGASIIALYIITRLWNIENLPPGIYPDEAVNGIDALEANESRHWKLFYTNNYGREGLFINLIALGFKLFGISIITLKMWSIIFGGLTCLGMILLAQELFGSWRAGMVAGFLYATSFWALNFNRIAFRANMLPFVLVFSFYYLFKGLRTEKTKHYILAGLFFGLGMHTYIAYRVAPAILILLLVVLIISRKKFIRTYYKPILAFIASILFVAFPMLVDFIIHPDHFGTRTGSVSVFNPEVNKGKPLTALAITLGKTLAMFNWKGDTNWRHNMPPNPQLEFFVGIFFLAGLCCFFYKTFRLLCQRFFRRERSDELVLAALLLGWLFIMLLPGVLSFEGIPHALRTIGALPAALLLATFTVEWIFQKADRFRKRYKKIILIGAVLSILLWSGANSLINYFIVWGGSVEIHSAFQENLKNMSLYINSQPLYMPKYVIINSNAKIMDDGLPIPAEVIKLLTYNQKGKITYLRSDFEASALSRGSRALMLYYDGKIVERVKKAFPNSRVTNIDLQKGLGTDFFVIEVN